ncbi:MAG: sulfite exporter TauE/SafE family protein [Desulfobacteraceae bacterium]|nr:sulfite exporter TauE/SafE family protein [Desulfobacteraceae bacterium]
MVLPGVDYVSMFMLGLLGTGHCVGMCGPLVFAFPGQTGRMWAHVSYHMGRMVTYTLIGMTLGGMLPLIIFMAGSNGGDAMGATTWIQMGVSLPAAVFMLLFGLIRVGILSEPLWLSNAAAGVFSGWSAPLRYFHAAGPMIRMFATGFVLGFIPCGLSYAVFAKAITSGGAVHGGLTGLVFGLGTLPGLLLLGTGASAFARHHRRLSDILSGVVMVAMGVSMAVKALGFLAA